MLLDTCALLWLAGGVPNKISKGTLQAIDRAPVVHISAITAFEISVKYHNGKLKLPTPPRTWLEAILSHHNISVLAMDAEICIKSAELPPFHHDPCDRFIIATGMIHNLPIVTADSRFADYGVNVLS